VDTKHDRRTFFRWAGIAVIGGIAVLWNRLVGTEQKLTTSQKITVPFDPTREYTFHEDFIIINQPDALTVLSTKCTHLGCRIREVNNDQLICPCHGSVYNLEGKPIKGPAATPLARPHYAIDDSNTQITVSL
jgi:cytochrome b6-f complex iron-sulfur subunit